MQVNFKLLLD